jgi:3-hydroxyacyl-[acyl-carrier-protein] dehydratase
MTDIKTLLPHRDPFLFVDRIEKADAEEVVGYRRFTSAEPFFAGHFPQYPVVPGVILIETLAQCGGAGLRMTTGGSGVFFLASVEKAKFRSRAKRCAASCGTCASARRCSARQGRHTSEMSLPPKPSGCA